MRSDVQFRKQLSRSPARARTLVNGIAERTVELQSIQTLTDAMPHAEQICYLLDRAARERDGVPDDLFVEFASTVVMLLGSLGAAGYGRHDQVTTAIDAAINRFDSTGKSSVPLLLAKALFVSYRNNEQTARLAALRAAEAKAHGDELLEARYWICWYLIDTSHYKKSVRLCNRSMNNVDQSSDPDSWLGTFLATRGIAHYTTLNKPGLAASDLRRAVEILERTEATTASLRSLGEALHYLGRLAHDDGEIRNCLSLYIRGNEVRIPNRYESRPTAFYHIRMAETLIGVENSDHARAHLDAAESHLDRLGDLGSARASLKYALANLEAADQNIEKAMQRLKESVEIASKSGFARGRALGLARIATLHWQRGEKGRSLMTILRALPLFFNGEFRRNSIVGILRYFRQYANRVGTPYKTGGHSIELIECPCSIHNSSHENYCHQPHQSTVPNSGE